MKKTASGNKGIKRIIAAALAAAAAMAAAAVAASAAGAESIPAAGEKAVVCSAEQSREPIAEGKVFGIGEKIKLDNEYAVIDDFAGGSKTACITGEFTPDTEFIGYTMKERLQGPSAAHWFGTDDMGRDIFSRVMYGARYSLLIAIATVALSLVVGVTLGAIAGFLGGKADLYIFRVLDVIGSIPGLMMGIIVVSALGRSTQSLVIAMAISALSNPLAAMVQKQLTALRGCEAHFTVILPEEDAKVYQRLGVHVSCEPKYEVRRLYHKK